MGFDAIQDAVTGDGHFLGGSRTMGAMERDYYYPSLANRDSPAVWNETGSPDAWQIARGRVREILKEHQQEYISRAVEGRIRERFSIHL